MASSSRRPAPNFWREGWHRACGCSILALLFILFFVLEARSLLGHLGTATTAGALYAAGAIVFLILRAIAPVTALPHFVLVECWPIALAAISFNKIVVDVNVNVALSDAGFSKGVLEKYYQQRYLWPGHVPGTTFSFHGDVHLKEITWGTLPAPDWFWLLAEYCFYLSAMGLAFYVLKEFFHGDDDKPNLCCRSFEDGAYLCFSWTLPWQPIYRRFIGAMIFWAVALPIIWIVELLLLFAQNEMEWSDVGNQLSVLVETTWTTGLTLVVALLRLGKFRPGGKRLLDDAPLVWHERDAPEFLQGFSVNRYAYMSCGFPGAMAAFEGNSALGSKFLDAMWQAEHGNPELLRKSLQRGEDAERWSEALDAARRIARSEGQRRREQLEEGEEERGRELEQETSSDTGEELTEDRQEGPSTSSASASVTIPAGTATSVAPSASSPAAAAAAAAASAPSGATALADTKQRGTRDRGKGKGLPEENSEARLPHEGSGERLEIPPATRSSPGPEEGHSWLRRIFCPLSGLRGPLQ